MEACKRCGGRVVEDQREGERYCVTCGHRAYSQHEIASAARAEAATLWPEPGKRRRAPRIGGLILD